MNILEKLCVIPVLSDGPPNNHEFVSVVEHEEKYTHTTSAHFLNDAFEVWICERYDEGANTDEAWKCSMRAEVFRLMAVWYLWRWAWGEWFGLRRWLYYIVLHARVQSYGAKRRRDAATE